MSGVPSGRCYNWLAVPDTMRPRLDPRSLAAMLPAGVLLLVLIAAAGLFATDGARVIRFRDPMDYWRTAAARSDDAAGASRKHLPPEPDLPSIHREQLSPGVP